MRYRGIVTLGAGAVIVCGVVAVIHHDREYGSKLADWSRNERIGQQIARACWMYQNEHSGELPADLAALIAAELDRGIIPKPGESSFAEELGALLLPAGMTREQFLIMEPAAQARVLDSSVPYRYAGKGVNGSRPDADQIIVLWGERFDTHPRGEDDGVDVKFAAYGSSRTRLIPQTEWQAEWQKSEAARQASGLPSAGNGQ